MLLMKSLTTHQKAHLPIALASLNNSHSYDLRTCYTGMRSLCRLSFVPVRPLCLRNTTWQSLLVVNLNSTTPGHAPAIEVEAHAIAGRCCLATTTLTRSLIWPCNNSMLRCCTSSFLVSPSLVSKPVRRRLSLRSSCLGTSARVSTARLT